MNMDGVYVTMMRAEKGRHSPAVRMNREVDRIIG